MVSLEEQNTYLSSALKNEKLRAFYSMLQLSSFEYSNDDLNEIDFIYFKIITSIIDNNKSSFKTCYEKINKRVPLESTPFIHNDYLIFSIILGTFLFNQDKSWIKMVVGKRAKSQITSTFESILNDNYGNNSNIQEIVTVFLFLTEKQKLTNETLEATYKSILNSPDLFQNKNDFQILISLKAFESILSLIKEFPNREEFNSLKAFEVQFKKRVKTVSNIIYSIVLLIAVYYLFRLVSLNQEIKDFLDNLNTVFGILGYLAISGGLFAAFKKRFESIIFRLLGYSKKV
jgi:hypothetical protein